MPRLQTRSPMMGDACEQCRRDFPGCPDPPCLQRDRDRYGTCDRPCLCRYRLWCRSPSAPSSPSRVCEFLSYIRFLTHFHHHFCHRQYPSLRIAFRSGSLRSRMSCTSPSSLSRTRRLTLFAWVLERQCRPPKEIRKSSVPPSGLSSTRTSSRSARSSRYRGRDASAQPLTYLTPLNRRRALADSTMERKHSVSLTSCHSPVVGS